jgi:predicted Zn-dependent peptidase
MCQFYTGGATENLPFSISVLCRVFSPIVLSSADIDRERKRIKAEIRESEDKSSISNISNGAVHSGTPLAYSILGTVKTADKINRRKLNLYREKITKSENVFFYLTGNFSESDVSVLLSEIDKYNIESGEARNNTAPVSPCFFKRHESEDRVIIKNSESVSVKFTFDVDMTKISMPEGDLLYDVLFGGYSSPFFVKMSEEEGLFYDITPSSERYKNIGNISLSFEVKEKELYHALEMALSIFASFKKSPLAPEDMMKSAYTENSSLLLDDVRELSFTFAYDNHIMDRNYKDVQSRSESYSLITPERLLACAKEIFKKENLTLVIKCNKKKAQRSEILSLIEKYL